MKNIETAVHWRLWAVGIVLALLISLFALNQFNMLRFTTSLEAGCAVLLLSLIWNGIVIKLNHSGSKLGWNGEIADGLLMTGMVLVFFGAFF
jgi:hypothetical protein